jgi:putative oxidoreductase
MDLFIKKCARYYVPFGRIIVGAYFVLAGIPKLFNLEFTAGMIEGVGFPVPMLFAILAVLIEVGGGLAIMINRYSTQASLLLAGFVLMVSFPFHGPHLWADDMMQNYTFMKNMALMGALLFMAAHLNDNRCAVTPTKKEV